MSDQFLMKGKVYGERKHLLTYPLFAEIKYDEIRLHVHLETCTSGQSFVRFLSYAGKPLHNLDAWSDHFEAFMLEFGLTDLDCGVLVNGNFNDSYRWVRSSTGYPKEKLNKATGKVDPALYDSMVRFYLFDIPEFGAVPWEWRVAHRALLVREAARFRLPMVEPGYWSVHCEAELDAKFVEVRELGYEGLMVKTGDHLYHSGCGKRIDGWLKLKPEDPADGRITAINRAKSIHGTPLDRAGSIDVELEDGSTASPAGIAHALGVDMWAHPERYIGRWVAFKYMERDRQGGYRHPSFVRFREDKA